MNTVVVLYRDKFTHGVRSVSGIRLHRRVKNWFWMSVDCLSLYSGVTLIQEFNEKESKPS